MKILHFADLHLGVETYGRPDPNTGLSSRLNDFLSAFDQLVDYALDSKVDLVLFCGDTYKSREPSQTQQREFARRVNRLAVAGIPVFLLIGNHDLPNAIGRATSTEIFDTLAVQNVYVASRPDIYQIPTASGDIQIAALPWLRRSSLLSREETRELDFEGINEKLQQILTGIITDFTAKLDPTLPTILAAHVWVAGATAGSEKSMTLGQEHALLLSNVANPTFDYVALGHIHKHQVLSESPPTVYAGSLERLDFGEEADDKGFYIVDIQSDETGSKKTVSYQFQSIAGRRFLTISLTLEANDIDPTDTVVKASVAQTDKISDAIVRLQLTLPAEVEGQLRDAEIRDALKEAHYFTIAKDIKRETRLRLGKWAAEEISPVEALKAYLAQKKVSPGRAKTLLEYGERLISGEETEGNDELSSS
ncbi:MAG: exonuclease SbcCD subunit D [Dehalococcoidales bacterium]|nr:MAG: exonuclease SbcCD subunit D [Dehalococcoidales bacterium]